MPTIREAVCGVKDATAQDVKGILAALLVAGYSGEEDASGSFLHLDVGALTGLSLRLQSIVKAAQAAAAAAVRVDVDLGRWAQELINLQEEDCCLHQPACQAVDLPPQLRHSLYIRHSYCKLFELVWDKCKRGKAGEQLGFIVTGTPGIGKSAFALYLVQQLGMRGQIACYEYEDEHRSRQRLKLDFCDIDSVVGKRIQLPASDDDLHLSLSWRILEGPPPKLEFSGQTKTVALSSPNRNNFSTWLKGRFACDPLYMPTWSLEELQACRKRLYPNVAVDIAAERYAWLGGSIRHVLVKSATDPRTLVLAAVHKQSAKELVYSIDKAFTWQSDFCHRLGHFQVKPNFSVRYVTFASPRVSDQVLEHLAAEHKQKLQRFLVGSKDLADLGSLRGVLCERHGHQVFQLGSIACK